LVRQRSRSLGSDPTDFGYGGREGFDAIDLSRMVEVVEEYDSFEGLLVESSTKFYSKKEYIAGYRAVSQYFAYDLKPGHKERIFAGSLYFLLSVRWIDKIIERLGVFSRCAEHVSVVDGPEWRPLADIFLPVDNSDLVSRCTVDQIFLQDGIEEGSNYKLVSREIWGSLMKFFGGGPAIGRRAIRVGGDECVDVFGKTLLFTCTLDLGRFRKANFCSGLSIGSVIETMRQRFGVQSSQVRMWDCHGGVPQNYFSELDLSLNDLEIGQNQLMLLEVASPTGEWSIAAHNSPRGRTSSEHEQEYMMIGQKGANLAGLVGLYNLRNTCYLNSALQCLSNVPQLRDYFVSGKFRQDINVDNPLGAHGRLAVAFGNLMRQIWNENQTTISPQSFKQILDEFNSDFIGYMQHDSQEALSCLLDGLHEDLNRVKKKQLTQPVEPNGRPNSVVAKESLDVYKLRNDSIVSDLCTGMLFSKVVCPACTNVSITFDPYMMLPLPVDNSANKSQTINCMFVPMEQPFRKRPLSVETPRTGPVLHLRNAVVKATGLLPTCFFLAEVSGHKILRIINDNADLDKLSDEADVYIFENTYAHVHLEMLHGEFVYWHRPRMAETNGKIIVQENDLNYHSAYGDDPVDDTLKHVQLVDDDETGNTIISIQKPLGVSTVSHGLCPFQVGQIWYGSFGGDNGRNKRSIRLEIVHVQYANEGFRVYIILDTHHGSKRPSECEQEARLLVGVYNSSSCEFSTGGGKEETDENCVSPTSNTTARLSSSRFSPRNVKKAILANFPSSVRRKSSATKETKSVAPPKHDPPPSKRKELQVTPPLIEKLGDVDLDVCGWKTVYSGLDDVTCLRRGSEFKCKGSVGHLGKTFYGKLLFESGHSIGSNDFYARLIPESHIEKMNKVDEQQMENSAENPNAWIAARKMAVSGKKAIRWVNRMHGGDPEDLQIYYQAEFCLDPGITVLDADITEEQVMAKFTEYFTNLYNDGVAHFNEMILKNHEESFASAIFPELPKQISKEETMRCFEVRRASRNYIIDGRDPFSGEQVDRSSEQAFFRDLSSFHRLVFIWAHTAPLVRLYEAMNTRIASSTSSTPSPKKNMQVYDCFDLFCTEEKLASSDSWYCSKCKKHRQATKTLEIWSLPPVLILHLKRFSQEADQYFSDKLSTQIDFPIEDLDLGDYVLDPLSKENALYDLCAVTNHYGGIGSGHYTAYARNEADGKWYEFDDDAVSHVPNVSYVCGNAAYVLFYLRKDLRPTNWNKC